MKKIPSLFVRDYTREVIGILADGGIMTTTPYSKPGKGKFLATEQITPGCEWVLNGEGIATRKWDGTAVLFMDGKWFKRYDAKHGKTPPPDFFEAQPEPDPVTGHWPGWVPVVFNTSADQYITEAIDHYHLSPTTNEYPPNGTTFEAIGPKINGNKEGYDHHTLQRHGAEVYHGIMHMFSTLRDARYVLDRMHVEGLVFHHPDGRMCKVKRSDFGLPW